MDKRSNPLDSWKGKLLWSVLVAGLAAWVYKDLAAVHSGAAESARVWWPVAVLYDHVGFWPAVLLLPIVSLFCLIFGVKQFLQERKA